MAGKKKSNVMTKTKITQPAFLYAREDYYKKAIARNADHDDQSFISYVVPNDLYEENGLDHGDSVAIFQFVGYGTLNSDVTVQPK